MTTITATAIKLTYEFQDVVAVGTSQAQLTMPSVNSTFSYRIIGSDPFPEVEIDDPLTQVILDGRTAEDIEQTSEIAPALGRVVWSGGTTTALVLGWETGPDSDIDLIFVLDGAPLPDFRTVQQWNDFNDSLSASAATGAFAPGANILFTELENATVTEDDELFGTPGRDTLNGGIGDDYFISSPGKDTYNGGPGTFDQVTFGPDPAGVTANLATGKATDGYGNTDTLNSIEVLRGSMFDDVLTGSGGRNVIRGLAGDDTMNGGKGVDEVRYDRDANGGGTAGVTVNLKKGTATDGFGDSDTLRKFEDVRGSEAGDNITGSGGKNDLEGLGGNDRLNGLGGNDTLWGDNGKDRLDGGSGNDMLTGGAKADRFIFAGNFGDDVISDFATKGKAEKIDLSAIDAIKSFRDLKKNHLSQDSGNAVIDDGSGNTITLDGVARADLSGNDFLF